MSLNDAYIIFGRVMNRGHVKCATMMSCDGNTFVRVVPIGDHAVHVGVRLRASKADRLLGILTDISASPGMGKGAKSVVKIISDPGHPAFCGNQAVTFGTFANKKITIGETIGDYSDGGGCIVEDDAGICKDTTFMQDYLYTFVDKDTGRTWTVDANPLTNALSMMNHPGAGMKANCKFEEQPHIDGDSVSVLVKATRHIAAGDEIMIDYGPHYWEPWQAMKNDRREFDLLLNKGTEDAHASMLAGMKPIVYRTMELIVDKKLGASQQERLDNR
jgi:hypothetical protein